MNRLSTSLRAMGTAIAFLTPLAAQNVGATFNATVDGYLEVPYDAKLVPQGGITIEAWITYDDSTLPTGWRYPTIVRQGISAGGENYFLRVNADNVGARVLRWKVATATNSVSVNWTFTAGQLNTWTHVAATYDGASAVLYINGLPVASGAGNGSPLRNLGNDVLRIGKGSDVATPIEVWNGSLDEVRLWPYARTQAEIQATKNQTLLSVPGRVSTWTLDNHLFDFSNGLNAISGGQVAFTANPLNLTTPTMALASGFSTPGCLGDLRLSPTSAAQPGNAAFAMVCARTPANALAVWGASVGALPNPFPLLGVGIWLDPTGLVTAGQTANGLGVLRLPIAIPANVPLGFSFAAQVLVLDACGPQAFTASDALSVVIVP